MGRLPDAPPLPDGEPNIPTGTVNVTTLARYHEDVPAKKPRPGVLVFSAKRDGGLAGMATTDADGKATVDVQEGGSVTVVYPENAALTRRSIASYVGVKPGDNLTFGDGYTNYLEEPGQTGEMMVTWSAVANASYYYVHSPCDSYAYTTGTSRTINLYDYCQTPTAPIVVVAYDANGILLSSAYVPVAAYTAGTQLAITPQQWIAQPGMDNFEVMLTGIDPATTSLDVRGYAEYARFAVEDYDYPPTETATATAKLSLPSTAPATSAYVQFRRNGYDGRQHFYKAGASPLAMNVGGLPWVAGVIASPALRQILWLQGPGAHDAAVLRLHWTRYGSETSHDFEWNAIIAPGSTQLPLDAFPSELAEYLPKMDDSTSVDFSLVDLSSAADYDALRALPEWRTTNPASAVRGGEEPAAGISEYDGGEGFNSFR